MERNRTVTGSRTSLACGAILPGGVIGGAGYASCCVTVRIGEVELADERRRRGVPGEAKLGAALDGKMRGQEGG